MNSGVAAMSASSQQFCYRKVTLFKTETLGTGSYGIVCKAKCDQLTCAAKIMHNALFKFSDPSTNTLLTKFKQECLLNSAAKHPNIVQYIHTYQDPDTGLPVLLMELCDESLTKFLERSKRPLPYHLEVDLSNDIVQALCYLHMHGVIHRDLTSNNVLLIAESRAKVTDFGMSKLISVNPRLTPLSMCPGNALYMSPEALQQPPRYSTKLDLFSWGVLVIQIMTRLFPDPGAQFNTVEEPGGRIIHEVIPEHRRRQSHIDLVDPKHPLLALAIRCISYNEKDRPTAEELCELVARLQLSQCYRQSKETATLQHQSQEDPQLRKQLEQMHGEMQKLSRELQTKDRELRYVHGEVARIKRDLSASERYAEGMQQTFRQRDETIIDLQRNIEQQQHIISTLRVKMDEDEAALAIKSASPHHSPKVPRPLVPPRSVQSLHQHNATTPLEQSTSALTTNRPNELHRQNKSDTIISMAELDARTIAKERVMNLNVMKGDKAPEKMSRGSAVVHANIAYFACFSSQKVQVCQSSMGREKWFTLPKCPYVNFGLAVINGFITTIGGCKSLGSDPTNTLLSLMSEGNKKKWIESVSPMPTPRQEMAVVSTEHFLVVMGGRGIGGERLNTVEIFKQDNRQWQVAGNLPIPLTRPTATLCGEEIFIGAGSPSQGSVSKAVYSSSLSKLLSPYHTFPVSSPRSSSSRPRSAWHKVTNIQADHYTLCTLSNKLIAVGGVEMSQCNSSAIRKYDAERHMWEVVGHINHGRCLSLAATLNGNRLLVVGGLGTPREGSTNTVDCATISFV